MLYSIQHFYSCKKKILRYTQNGIFPIAILNVVKNPNSILLYSSNYLTKTFLPF